VRVPDARDVDSRRPIRERTSDARRDLRNFADDDVLAEHRGQLPHRVPVDLARGRVLPSFSLDVSTSVVLVKTRTRTLRLQADVLNATDRLNVINFAGVFSGTAIAPPRSASVRVQAEF
jgi:hypothetical protein